MVDKALFSSDKTEWETPWWLFNELNDKFGFTLDVCATAENAKCKEYITPEEDALQADWSNDICWMNPPYGRYTIGKWVAKAYEESQKGAVVVCLLPARTDTKWFHFYIWDSEKMEFRFPTQFIQGRIKFINAEHGAPFPSMIVIFQPEGWIFVNFGGFIVGLPEKRRDNRG